MGLTRDLFWARAVSGGGRIEAGLKSGRELRIGAGDPNGELARRLRFEPYGFLDVLKAGK